MEIVKAILINTASVLLALMLIVLVMGATKKKGGCGCASCSGAAPAGEPVVEWHS